MTTSPIRAVTRYKTPDGLLHETRQEAEAHFNSARICNELHAWVDTNFPGFTPSERAEIHSVLWEYHPSLIQVLSGRGDA